MDKLSQLYQDLVVQWGSFWLKNKKKILGSIVLGMGSAVIVYLSSVFRIKKGTTVNFDEAQRRIDRDRQEKFEQLVLETKRVEKHADIIEELNRSKHAN
jgi:hypothetical protein